MKENSHIIAVVGQKKNETQQQYAERLVDTADQAFKVAIAHCVCISKLTKPDVSEEERLKDACDTAVRFVEGIFEKDMHGSFTIQAKR